MLESLSVELYKHNFGLFFLGLGYWWSKQRRLPSFPTLCQYIIDSVHKYETKTLLDMSVLEVFMCVKVVAQKYYLRVWI